MSIAYDLKINTVTKKFSVGEFSNVIVDVNLSVSAQSEEHPQFTYNCSGVVSLDTENLTEESFIDFQSITNDTIIEWLLLKEGVSSVSEFSYVKNSIENIQDRINQLLEEETVAISYSVTGSANIITNQSNEQQSTILEPEPEN